MGLGSFRKGSIRSSARARVPAEVRPGLIPFAAALGLLGASLALAPDVSGAGPRSDILPLARVEKGMKGYGLTVFEGTKPDRFDVEVLDVLRNFRPKQDLILVRTSHPRLEVAKIVAGMSGSPIYLGGKMAGAYAYGWSFGAEPVAGVTPIEAMLSDLDRPLPRVLRGIPLAPVRGASASGTRARAAFAEEGASGRYDVLAHARALARTAVNESAVQPDLRPIQTPLLLGGAPASIVSEARSILGPLGLEPLAMGGAAPPHSSKTEPFVDGGAIGIQLVSGDLSALGLGTVTRVEGRKLVAFGHPMMEIGVTALPAAQARVLWFMASVQRSFKVGESLGARGMLVNDRQASIVVDQESVPRTIPLSLRIRGEAGAPHPNWDFVLAHDPFITPAFLGMALGSGIQTTAAERRDVTFRMRSRVKLSGHPEMMIEDLRAAPTGVPEAGQLMQSNLVVAVGTLFNNPWEDIVIESVQVDVELTFAREVSVLRGVDVLTPEVEPGGSVRLRLWIEPHVGPRRSELISVPLPESFENQEVKLTVRPGHAVERIKPPPESVQDLLHNFEDTTLEPRSVVVSMDTGEASVVHRGLVAESLPPGAIDRLTTTTHGLTPLEFRTTTHKVFPSSDYLVGSQVVTVRVKKRP